ncbi:DNA-processing protein DprA [Treponema sp.]|uniref:DNA-processing protein DprA n=1 Tax=Treponema sp. TaxID=166 RepID=UPI0025DE952D|nr:DNA-processing protein DprA [Treponema sp.]MCR5217193.1 DNA-protecting protein DprA [Treponema sp.]
MNSLDIAISSITFLSLKEKLLLKTNLDSLDKLAVLSIEDISEITGRVHSRCVWNPEQTAALAEKSLALALSYGMEALCFSEEAYPLLLKHAFDAPYMIFYRGNIECLYKNCISVVGTRRLDIDAARTAFEFSRDACRAGFTVVSGLADGTDSFAHKGAVASGLSMPTAAVLPCGTDSVVPLANKSLALEILKRGGCLLSEYIPGTPAEKWRFVQRNRIIAALSCATVVVQAPAGSGALITADFALDYNRELLFCSCCRDEGPVRQKKAGLKSGKVLKSPGDYLKEGAPVINNFADFIQVMKDPPGMHACSKKSQMELFDA